MNAQTDPSADGVIHASPNPAVRRTGRALVTRALATSEPRGERLTKRPIVRSFFWYSF